MVLASSGASSAVTRIRSVDVRTAVGKRNHSMDSGHIPHCFWRKRETHSERDHPEGRGVDRTGLAFEYDETSRSLAGAIINELIFLFLCLYYLQL
jgi:hypothetical protein